MRYDVMTREDFQLFWRPLLSMRPVCQTVTFDSVHALNTMYATFAHRFGGTDVRHRPTGIAAQDQLQGKQKHRHTHNS